MADDDEGLPDPAADLRNGRGDAPLPGLPEPPSERRRPSRLIVAAVAVVVLSAVGALAWWRWTGPGGASQATSPSAGPATTAPMTSSSPQHVTERPGASARVQPVPLEVPSSPHPAPSPTPDGEASAAPRASSGPDPACREAAKKLARSYCAGCETVTFSVACGNGKCTASGVKSRKPRGADAAACAAAVTFTVRFDRSSLVGVTP